MAEQEWMSEVRAKVGREYGRVYAWDEVNAPMIRQWCEVMGVDNPLYTDAAYAIAARRSGQVPDPLSLFFPNAHDGLQGLRFVTAAMASSANQGAWTAL